MVRFYVDKIQRGIMTIDNVPQMWKEKVEEQLGGNEQDGKIDA